MANKLFSKISDGTNSYEVKDAAARTDISSLDSRIDNLEVDDLANINISSPSDGQTLVYDETADEWVNADGGTSNVKEWVGTSAQLAQAIAQGTIEDDTNILVTNDYTPGGGGGSLSHVYINTPVNSEVTLLKPDGVTTIIPTAVTTTQWECDVDVYGTYTVGVSVDGGTAHTQTVSMNAVGVYTITYASADNSWTIKIGASLQELSDVSISTLSDGQVLAYNNVSGKFENKTPAYVSGTTLYL